jgi:hypothetical protein
VHSYQSLQIDTFSIPGGQIGNGATMLVELFDPEGNMVKENQLATTNEVNNPTVAFPITLAQPGTYQLVVSCPNCPTGM